MATGSLKLGGLNMWQLLLTRFSLVNRVTSCCRETFMSATPPFPCSKASLSLSTSPAIRDRSPSTARSLPAVDLKSLSRSLNTDNSCFKNRFSACRLSVLYCSVRLLASGTDPSLRQSWSASVFAFSPLHSCAPFVAKAETGRGVLMEGPPAPSFKEEAEEGGHSRESGAKSTLGVLCLVARWGRSFVSVAIREGRVGKAMGDSDSVGLDGGGACSGCTGLLVFTGSRDVQVWE